MLNIRPAAIWLIVGLAIFAMGAAGCRAAPTHDRPGRAEPAQGRKKKQEKPGLLTRGWEAPILTQLELERT